MDSLNIEGTAQHLDGKVEDATGGVIGDAVLQVDGETEQGTGQLRAFGGKVMGFAKRQPLAAAGITLVVGILLGRGSKR